MVIRKVRGKGKKRKKRKRPQQIIFYQAVIKEIEPIFREHGFKRDEADYGSKGRDSIHNDYVKSLEDWGGFKIYTSIHKYSYFMTIDYAVYIYYPNEEDDSIFYYKIAYNRIFEKWLRRYWLFPGYMNKLLKAEILRRVEENMRWFVHFSQPEEILWIYENVTMKLSKGEEDPIYKTRRMGTAKEIRIYHFLRQLTEARKNPLKN